MSTASTPERRHGGRAAASGTVILHLRRDAVHGRLVDLGIGGLRMELDAPARVRIGAWIVIDLRLDGCRTEWQRAVGRVTRLNGRRVAIAFRTASADLEDLVQDELVAALDCARVPRVVVVDRNRSRCTLIAAAFRAAGCRVFERSAPLGVVHVLDDSRIHAWMIAIADSTPSRDARQLRGFLRAMYPAVRLIAIGRRRGRGRARLSVDRRPDLALQVQRLVETRHAS